MSEITILFPMVQPNVLTDILRKFEKPGYVLPGGYTSPDGATMHKKGFDQWWYIVEYNCRTERRECITHSSPISCANLLNMLSTWLSRMLTLD